MREYKDSSAQGRKKEGAGNVGVNLKGMKRRGYTVDDLKKSKVAAINQDIIEQLEGSPKKKRSKYGNKKTEVCGEVFDSEREANDYKILLLRQKAGEIGLIRRQVEYELNAGGSHSLIYRADFVYRIIATGEEVVQDSKGVLTKEYKKKRRLMKKIYGITIKET